MMITEADLLQATIIAGILIFLTIAPISKGISAQIWERKVVLISITGTLMLLMASMVALLFQDNIWIPSFVAARFLSIVGLIGIILTLGLLLGLYPRITREQKGQDQG